MMDSAAKKQINDQKNLQKTGRSIYWEIKACTGSDRNKRIQQHLRKTMPWYNYARSFVATFIPLLSIGLPADFPIFRCEIQHVRKHSKKDRTFPSIRMEVRPRTRYNMPENVRQDVKAQSHRIHFTQCCSKYHFYLVGFHAYLLKHNGFQKARCQCRKLHWPYTWQYNF